MGLEFIGLVRLCAGHRRKLKSNDSSAESKKIYKPVDGHNGASSETPEEELNNVSLSQDGNAKLAKSVALYSNLNTTSCAQCNNLIFLAAGNHREARVGGSSFKFCRDKCWEEWMDGTPVNMATKQLSKIDTDRLPFEHPDMRRIQSVVNVRRIPGVKNRLSLGIL